MTVNGQALRGSDKFIPPLPLLVSYFYSLDILIITYHNFPDV